MSMGGSGRAMSSTARTGHRPGNGPEADEGTFDAQILIVDD